MPFIYLVFAVLTFLCRTIALTRALLVAFHMYSALFVLNSSKWNFDLVVEWFGKFVTREQFSYLGRSTCLSSLFDNFYLIIFRPCYVLIHCHIKLVHFMSFTVMSSPVNVIALSYFSDGPPLSNLIKPTFSIIRFYQTSYSKRTVHGRY